MLCKTAHAMAYAALGHRYTSRLNSPRQPAWKTGQALGITRPVRIGDHEISPRTLSHTVLRTVTRFCHSADRTLARHHVPRLRGLDTPGQHAQLAHEVLPFARKAWADLQNPDDGAVRFEHDHYLKMWALTEPTIEADFLLLDEAQDTNPVLEQVFAAQRDHAQLVMVGDSAQAIYGWRGARDVMTGFDATHLTLTRSFRFGPLLAEEANRWLALADAPIRLTGTDTIPTEVGHLDRAGRGAVPHQHRRHGRSHAPARRRPPRRPDPGRTAARRTRPRRPRPQRRPPHHPPRTRPLPLLGRSCRTTPSTIPPAATCSPSSTSSTPTAPTPSSPPSTNSPTRHMPR